MSRGKSRHLSQLQYRLVVCLGLVTSFAISAHSQAATPQLAIVAAISSNQYDLAGDGQSFLLSESAKNDFFMLGELHGENEIPAVIHDLWPAMWKQGYRHVAAEVSPWMANQLETAPPESVRQLKSLWTKSQANTVRAFVDPKANVIWGCDMEEIQPQFLIRELAALNPSDLKLKQMADLTKDGYTRAKAAQLLALAKESKSQRDKNVNAISLRQNLLATLEIDANRANPQTKMTAQIEREPLMKTQFLEHLRSVAADASSKIFLRFGRNHLHRGYDARGISTLGNFIAEFAFTRHQAVFNVGAFGAGGKATLAGETFDADERQDEPTFALLAEKAKFPATVFDLRPLRPLLHAIPQENRSALENNLVYWADSYDALICFKNVTPLEEN